MTDRIQGGVWIPRPIAFWGGALAVAVGVGLHLPMYFDAAGMHYRLAGMSPDPGMLIGMAAIVLGLISATYGLLGGREAGGRERAGAGNGMAAGKSMGADNGTGSIRALDEAPLTKAHLMLLAVMAVAVTIDAMKPIALGFVAPGMAKEYGLKSPLNPHGSVPVALLPVFGLSGTVIGSFAWGYLGDRIGRRASILLAGLLFVATSICGAMPSYQWNFAMCLLMGIGVGGMLPITLTLIAELLPARHRGWAIVLIGGEVALAYVITSWLSSALVPTYSWRVLWLIGLPTGLLLIGLQRFIPESPRFLLLRGRTDEAWAVMRRYGAAPRPAAAPVADERPRSTQPGSRALGAATIVTLLALGVGVVTYGFQLWIPTNLTALGFRGVTSSSVLRDSALLGLPVTLAFAAIYALWSARGTIIVLTVLTVAALIAFALAGNTIARHSTELHLLLAVPTATINALLAAVLAYATEAAPTAFRARGAGLAAGLSKAGGVAVTALVAASVAPPSIRDTALLPIAPLVLGAVAVGLVGHETRRRTLEETSSVLAAPQPA